MKALLPQRWWRFEAVLVAWGLSEGVTPVSAEEPGWRSAAEFVSLREWRGALCDDSGLEATHCGRPIFKILLQELCRHCRDAQCVADAGLTKIATEVLHLYTSMVVQHGEAILGDFGCKHGVLAALLYNSEHVGYEFRPPQATVEVVKAARELNFTLTAADRDRLDEKMDTVFRDAGFPIVMAGEKYLKITSKDGQAVSYPSTIPDVNDFPLHIHYKPPPEQHEFIYLRRHFMMDGNSVLVKIAMPVMSLAPFPLHTNKFRAMRQVTQDEYTDFLGDVSNALSASGIFHVLLPGDSTSVQIGKHFGFLNISSFLVEKFGVESSQRPDTDGSSATNAAGASLRRFSFFLPLELREMVGRVLWGPGDGPLGLGRHRHAVELGLGHIQLGEMPYYFARGVNYRIFCSHCLWVSFYFYATEGVAPSASYLLPLAYWLPCRIPMDAVFPVRAVALKPEVLLPHARSEKTEEVSLAATDADVGLRFASQRNYSKPDIYKGSCREALARALAKQTGPQLSLARGGPLPSPALPPVIPELLPMHDISGKFDEGTNLDVLMALKQIHEANGLEMYQDKIALSKQFADRGLRVPRLYYSSYDASFDLLPTLRELDEQHVPYVAKASHMCCSLAVFVMEDEVDRVSGQKVTHEQIQESLQQAFANPFTVVTPTCGDWGTVKAGEKPGVLVEELLRPSIPVEPLLEKLGGGEWLTPDIVACHLMWSALFHCVWEMKLRDLSGKVHTEELGVIFRDGSCLGCRYPMPFKDDWSGTVALLEELLPHADYLRITLFVKDGKAVLNEIEYTTGGLETVPVRIAQEWTLLWTEGYHRYNS
eukprot:TRINITY_DN23249_c0_g1_i5.p1 TRINITY_DN23249_c0_g1~~TRINITY_DN23249_c0_g1_i5.p1  ORF type:complete len:823 (-),score=163.09 TRINITY_DN23249_c0_g1_i5:13-2481(-)